MSALWIEPTLSAPTVAISSTNPVPCARSPGLSENPLLPHSKLRELHALMVRCRSLERKERSRASVREALLAATLIHLLPGDLLSAGVGDRVVETLAPEGKHQRPGGSLIGGDALGRAATSLRSGCAGIAGRRRGSASGLRPWWRA